MKQSRRLKEMESKQEWYKDQFTKWIPPLIVFGEDIQPQNVNQLFQLEREWDDIAVEIKAMMWSAKTYVKAKSRFKK